MYGIPIPHAASKANIHKTEVWHVSLPHFRLRLVIGLDAHHAQDTKCGKSIYILSLTLGTYINCLYKFHLKLHPATSNHTSLRPRWQPGTHECHERLPSLATALSPLRPWTHLAVGFGRSATSAIRLELQPGAFQKRDPFRGAKKDAGFREGWFEFQTSTVRRARNDISVADSLEFGFHFEHACALSSNFHFQLFSLWKQCVDAAFHNYIQLSPRMCRPVKTFWVWLFNIFFVCLLSCLYLYDFIDVYNTSIRNRLTVMMDGKSHYALKLLSPRMPSWKVNVTVKVKSDIHWNQKICDAFLVTWKPKLHAKCVHFSNSTCICWCDSLDSWGSLRWSEWVFQPWVQWHM